MKALPLRLQGFFDAISAISDGAYREGGLSIKYPASFDRNDLEMIWICGGVKRSGGFFELASVEDIARFFDQVLSNPSGHNAKDRLQVANEFLALVKNEMAAKQLELWYNDDGMNATVYVCINPGTDEQWIELFWSVD